MLNLMSEMETNNNSDLEISVLPNGIHVYKLATWSTAGLKHWEESLSSRLDEADDFIYSIYDMRHLETISPRGFEFANRLEAHAKSHLSYGVAVLKSRRLAILVDAVITMRRNSGRNRIFFSLEDAAEWLIEQMEANGQSVQPPPTSDLTKRDGLDH